MNRMVWVILAVVFVATEVAGFMGDSHYIPGFYALFGWGSSVVLILLAKSVGKRFLMKKETGDDV